MTKEQILRVIELHKECIRNIEQAKAYHEGQVLKLKAMLDKAGER